MSALELAAEIAADLRNRERRFALGYTDHGLTRPQIAAYYRRQAVVWRSAAVRRIADNVEDEREQTDAFLSLARACDRRAKEYEK
jgi:hypothetical protein